MKVLGKNNLDRKNYHPVISAMVGAVVGGVAVAGALAVANKGNQEKVKHAVADVATNIKDKKAIIDTKIEKLDTIAKDTVKDIKNI